MVEEKQSTGQEGNGGGSEETTESKNYTSLEDVFADFPDLKKGHEDALQSESDRRVNQAQATWKKEQEKKEADAKAAKKKLDNPPDDSKPLTRADMEKMMKGYLEEDRSKAAERIGLNARAEKLGLESSKYFELDNATFQIVIDDLEKSMPDLLKRGHLGPDNQPPKPDAPPKPISDAEKEAARRAGMTNEEYMKEKAIREKGREELKPN